MKILFVGPHPFKGGGVAYHQQALAKDFYKKGKEVIILSLITLNRRAKKSYIKEIKKPDFKFAKAYELISNKISYFRNADPILDCIGSEEEAIFVKFLKKINPDLIHFHAARPASIIKISKELGIPVVISLHDYWFICNMGFLCRRNGMVCNGPNGGLNCAVYCNADIVPFLKLKETFKKFLSKKLINSLRYIKNKSLPYFTRQDYIDNLLNISKNKKNSQQFERNTENWKFRTNFMKETLNKHADLIIAVSNEVKRIFVENGIGSQKIKVLHSGFEYADNFLSFNKKKKNLINFAYIGPIWQEKGLHILLKAFQKISKDRNCNLYIYGKISMGSYGYVMKNLIKKMNMQNITFKGEFNYNDLPSIYENIDIQIIPPITPDPSPRTVWEALSSGTPPIASNIGGIPDFIKDGVNGLLFEAGNPNDLAEKMKMVLNNQSLIEKLRKGIEKLKTIDQYGDELIKIYEGLLKNEIKN